MFQATPVVFSSAITGAAMITSEAASSQGQYSLCQANELITQRFCGYNQSADAHDKWIDELPLLRKPGRYGCACPYALGC